MVRRKRYFDFYYLASSGQPERFREQVADCPVDQDLQIKSAFMGWMNKTYGWDFDCIGYVWINTQTGEEIKEVHPLSDEAQAAERYITVTSKVPGTDAKTTEGKTASEPEGREQPPVEPLDDLVTLAQAASMAHRRKRSLEHYKKRDLPLPQVEGGGGRPALWEWAVIRPWLESTFGLRLPSTFPANRRA